MADQIHIVAHIWLWLNASGYMLSDIQHKNPNASADTYMYTDAMRQIANRISVCITEPIGIIYNEYMRNSNISQADHIAICKKLIADYYKNDGGRVVPYDILTTEKMSDRVVITSTSNMLTMLYYMVLTPELDYRWMLSWDINDKYMDECIYIKGNFTSPYISRIPTREEIQQLLHEFRHHMGVDYAVAVIPHGDILFSSLEPCARMPHVSNIDDIRFPTFFAVMSGWMNDHCIDVQNTDKWSNDYYIQGTLGIHGLTKLRGKIPYSHETHMVQDPSRGTIYEYVHQLYPRNFVFGIDMLGRLLSNSVMSIFGLRQHRMDKVVTMVYDPILSLHKSNAVLQITYDGRIFICDTGNDDIAYRIMRALAKNIHLITPIMRPSLHTIESFSGINDKRITNNHPSNSSHNLPSRRFPIINDLIGQFPTVTRSLSSGRVMSIYNIPNYRRTATSILFVRDVLKKKQPNMALPYHIERYGDKNIGEWDIIHNIHTHTKDTYDPDTLVTAYKLSTMQRMNCTYMKDGQPVVCTALYFDEPKTPFFSVTADNNSIVTRYTSHTMYTTYKHTLNTSETSTRDNRSIISRSIESSKGVKSRVDFRLSNAGIVISYNTLDANFNLVTPLKVPKYTALFSCMLGDETRTDIIRLYNTLVGQNITANELMFKLIDYLKQPAQSIITPVPTGLLWTVYGPHCVTRKKKFIDYIPIDPIREAAIFEHFFHDSTIFVFLKGGEGFQILYKPSQIFWESSGIKIALYIYETLQHAWAFDVPAFHYASPIDMNAKGLRYYFADRSHELVDGSKLTTLIPIEACGGVVDDYGIIKTIFNINSVVISSNCTYILPRNRIPMIYTTGDIFKTVEKQVFWMISARECTILKKNNTDTVYLLNTVWDTMDEAAEALILQLTGALSIKIPDIGNLPKKIPIFTDAANSNNKYFYRRWFNAHFVELTYPPGETVYKSILDINNTSDERGINDYDVGDEVPDEDADKDEEEYVDQDEINKLFADGAYDADATTSTAPQLIDMNIGGTEVKDRPDGVLVKTVKKKKATKITTTPITYITLMHRRAQWITPYGPISETSINPGFRRRY